MKKSIWSLFFGCQKELELADTQPPPLPLPWSIASLLKAYDEGRDIAILRIFMGKVRVYFFNKHFFWKGCWWKEWRRYRFVRFSANGIPSDLISSGLQKYLYKEEHKEWFIHIYSDDFKGISEGEGNRPAPPEIEGWNLEKLRETMYQFRRDFLRDKREKIAKRRQEISPYAPFLSAALELLQMLEFQTEAKQTAWNNKIEKIKAYVEEE